MCFNQTWARCFKFLLNYLALPLARKTTIFLRNTKYSVDLAELLEKIKELLEIVEPSSALEEPPEEQVGDMKGLKQPMRHDTTPASKKSKTGKILALIVIFIAIPIYLTINYSSQHFTENYVIKLVRNLAVEHRKIENTSWGFALMAINKNEKYGTICHTNH